MIYEGTLLPPAKLFCPGCGELTYNLLPTTSAFTRTTCHNKACEMRDIAITVEKCSNTVFSTSAHYIVDGKPAWPSQLCDRDGNIVWTAQPKKKKADKIV